MAQCALNSSSTGRWQVFPYTNWYGDIPIGALYVVRYAQGALGNLSFHAIGHLIDCLLKNILDLFVGSLCLATCLRMVGGSDVVTDSMS